MKRLMTGVLVTALLLSQTSIADVFVKTDAATVTAAEQDAESVIEAEENVEVYNAEGRKISAFIELPDDIKVQSVPVGTALEELKLPDTLEAVCVVTVADVDADAEVDEDTNIGDDTDADAGTDTDVNVDKGTDANAGIGTATDIDTDTDIDSAADIGTDTYVDVSNVADTNADTYTDTGVAPDDDALGGGTADAEGDIEEVETFSVTMPEYQTENVIEVKTLEADSLSETPDEQPEDSREAECSEISETSWETIIIENITWQSEPEYDGDTEGEYIFTAVLPEGYVLTDKVNAPQITVTVGGIALLAAEPMPLAAITTISNIDDFIEFRNDVNAGNTYSGQTVTLTTDIQLSGEWTPIGIDRNHPFSGTFDGGGHTISAVSINLSDASAIHAGLFGYVSGSTIQNLTVNGTVDIIASSRAYVGGIVGYNSKGTITNCRNQSAINIDGGTVGSTFAGGIVGQDFGGTVINCRNQGTVTGTKRSAFVGGIVGGNSLAATIIKNCWNEGDVTGKCAGGIIGSVYNGGEAVTEIENCWNEGDVTGDNDAGGIMVYFARSDHAIIKNCGNKGNITGGHGGGILNFDDASNETTITNCYYLSGTANKGIGEEDDAEGQVEAKTSTEFASGEVAWLLQKGQEAPKTLVWGQQLGVDPSPRLACFMDGDDTAKETKRVLKVAFYNAANDTAYTPYGDKTYINKGVTVLDAGGAGVSSQEYPAEIYKAVWLDFSELTGNNYSGKIFRKDTPIEKDTEFYLFYKELFNSEDATLTAPSGTAETKDLDECMKYAGNSSAAGNFTYEITAGNEQLGARLSGSTLTIPGTADEGRYELTIEASEKTSQMENLIGEVFGGGTDSVTFTLTVTVGKSEQTPEAFVDRPSGKIKGLTPKAKYDITYTDANGTPHTDTVTADESGSLEIKDGWTDGTVDIVKKGNGTDISDSQPQQLVIPEREPGISGSLTVTNESVKGANDGKVGGLVSGEEYEVSTDGGKTWKKKTANDKGEISPLAPGSYDVRRPAGANTLPSKSVHVTIQTSSIASGSDSTGGDSGNTGSDSSTGGNNGGSSSGSGNGSQSSGNNSGGTGTGSNTSSGTKTGTDTTDDTQADVQTGTGTRNGRGNSTGTKRSGTSSASSADSTDNKNSSQSASTDEATNSTAEASTETDRDAGQSEASGTDGQTTGSTAQTVKTELKDGKITVEGDVVVTGTVRSAETTTMTLSVGEGAVIVTVVSDESRSEAGVADTVAVANAVLTPEQIQLVNGGETIEIRVDVKDISGQVSQEDKNIIESGLSTDKAAGAADGEETEELTLGAYIDISMYIKIGDGDWDAITRTDDPIEVVIGIPEELQDGGRTYYIARAHEGEYALLEDLDDEADTITIRTGMFSTYAIVFKQIPGAGEDASSGFLASLSWTAVALWSLGILVMIAVAVILILGKRRKEEEAS